MIGKLYIVGTPIGNMGDITVRALATLEEADLVLCEDTRVTKKLLSHFSIDTPTKSYHQHSDQKRVKEIVKLLSEGKNLALVTDAGTPGISDPGNELVAQIANSNEQIAIVPVPGVSAVVTALSISGFPTDKFVFMGFPPHKNKRKKFFEGVAKAKYTVAFYESSHRIQKAIKELSGVLLEKTEICICRELTKKFESVYRGTIAGIEQIDIAEKGEFVVLIKNK